MDGPFGGRDALGLSTTDTEGTQSVPRMQGPGSRFSELPLVGLPVYDATEENISVADTQKDVGRSCMRTGQGRTATGNWGESRGRKVDYPPEER